MLIASTFFGGSNAGLAQEHSVSDAALIEALRAFIPHVMEWDNTSGLSIALARHGTIVWEEGFGYADLEKRLPMTS
jgi:CubicO group peptidase (beta-lactamase class C family)